MADETENVTAKFNLDVKDSVDGVLKLGQSIKGLGNSENFVGVLEGLGRVGAIAGVLGATFFALKEVFNMALEGEKINQINVGFEELSKQAGIATATLKKGLLDASAGLVDDTDLLKAANKALVELGSNAQKLPEIMELSRKATAIFGGDLISNFEGINQAIATGNLRMLKHLGLHVDADKAIRKYADANGLAVSSLSEFAKQQAIMNEVLESGNKRFAGVDDTVVKANNSWTRFKNTLHNALEGLEELFARAFGPGISKLLDTLSDMVDKLTVKLKAHYGEGQEQSDARIKNLENELRAEQKKLDIMNSWGPASKAANGPLLEESQKRIEALSAELEKLERIDGLKNKNPNKTVAGGVDEESKVDPAKKAEADKKYYEMREKFREQDNQDAIKYATNEVDLTDAQFTRMAIITAKHQDEVKAIIADKDLDRAQKAELVALTEERYNDQIKHSDAQLFEERKKMWDNYAATATSYQDGISKGFKASQEKDKIENEKFGLSGARVYNSFKNSATNAFLAVGAGQKNVGEAMRDMAFGVIADEAQAKGAAMMLESIWPPNPLGLAGGAGLIALAGALRSAGGGGSGAGVATSTPSSGGAYPYLPAESSAMTEESKMPEKNVTINIQGHYMETEQTRQFIADTVRANQDATGYVVTSGVGIV